MKLTVRATLAVAASAAAVASFAPVASAHPRPAGVTYAVIGDTPYGQAQVDAFGQDVDDINAAPGVTRVIHLGDIKSGSSRCDDAYYRAIRGQFDRFRDPLVYTPGDNEWTDCHRTNNGGYNPAERLSAIRQVFFPQPGRTLGRRPARVTAQAAPTVENVTWTDRGVVFATVHVVGSNNDWAPWFGVPERSPEQVAEYTQRNTANVEWIRRVFADATASGAPAVVIGMQADMWDPFFSGPNDAPAQYEHLTDTVRALADGARAYGRPVLLLNGDSHTFVDDRPLADPARPYQRLMYGVTAAVPNLRRVTVNGSSTPCREWLRLSVNPRRPGAFQVVREAHTSQAGVDPALCQPGTPAYGAG